MDFGKMSPHRGIDFSLSPLKSFLSDPVQSSTHFDEKYLKNGFKPDIEPFTRVYLGAPVWQHSNWEGKVYPLKISGNEKLREYSKVFNSVEVNATFYKIPEKAIVSKWYEETSEDFKFVLKIPKQISHDHPLSHSKNAIHVFLKNIETLKEKLGVVFLQLPPFFSFDHRKELFSFVKMLSKDFQYSIEFRHPSWFQNRVLNEKASEWLSSLGISAVITDTTGRRDVSHCSVTSQNVMVRFLGNELHNSDENRLQDWAERLNHFYKVGVQNIYFFIHQPNEETTPETTDLFYHKIKDSLHLRCRFDKFNPSLNNSFHNKSSSDNQLSLF